jgi:putative endopeptidase
MIIVDPHSLPRFRINGILPHIEDFYRLFEVTKEDKMFLEKDKRCGLYD